MSLADILALLVVFVAVPLVWLVMLVLGYLIYKDPHNGILRGMVALSLAIALIVTVFGLVFVNNDMDVPWLDPEQTRILTRGSLLVLSVVPALYVLRLWFHRR